MSNYVCDNCGYTVERLNGAAVCPCCGGHLELSIYAPDWEKEDNDESDD